MGLWLGLGVVQVIPAKISLNKAPDCGRKNLKKLHLGRYGYCIEMVHLLTLDIDLERLLCHAYIELQL